MGQVHVRAILTNHREAVMAQFGQLDVTGCIIMRRKRSLTLVQHAHSSLQRAQIVGLFRIDAQMRHMPIAALRKSM